MATRRPHTPAKRTIYRGRSMSPNPGLHATWGTRIDELGRPTPQGHRYRVVAWPTGEPWNERVVGDFQTKGAAWAGAHTYIKEQATGKRRRNPTGRKELIDDLTGEMLKPAVLGASPTGEIYVRVRPEKGEPFEIVPFDYETGDPLRDQFGIDPKMASAYKEDAKRAAKERKKEEARLKKKKPRSRDDELTLRRLGVYEKFPGTTEGYKIFEGMNEWLDADWLQGADITDEIRELMQTIEVARGRRDTGRTFGGAPIRKMVRLTDTPQGRKILGEDGRSSADSSRQVQRLAKWIISQGKNSWRDVPWGYMESLYEMVMNARDEEGTFGAQSLVYPLGSGMFSFDEEVASARLSPKQRENALAYLTSQELFRIVDDYKKALRETRRCISAENKRIVRERVKTLEQWAKYPELVPEYACWRDPYGQLSQELAFKDPTGPAPDPETFPCTFRRFRQDIQMLNFACDEPYDPYWTGKNRVEEILQMAQQYDVSDVYLAQKAIGFAPIQMTVADSARAEQIDDLNEPWDEPWEQDTGGTAANPDYQSLKRRLMR